MAFITLTQHRSLREISTRPHGLSIVKTWIQRHRQRQDLLALNGDQLLDIGISRKAAEREADKPFWRA
jgi:uncharacterized protein YjiS (DUF1127 family)